MTQETKGAPQQPTSHDPPTDFAPIETQSQDETVPQEPEVPATNDPVGTRILFVVVAMIVLMFLISVGFLLLVVRRRL